MTDTIDLFDEPKSFPDSDARRRYSSLVGLDEMKETVVREALALLAPESVQAWSKKHHGKVLRAVELLADRTPLLVFCGDVGTGKTALAESFGDEVTRRAGIDVLLFPLSLSARGTGSVGEMTKLLAAAFAYVGENIPKPTSTTAGVAGILLIDEADALAQSRELSQMHHEDRAGVNAPYPWHRPSRGRKTSRGGRDVHEPRRALDPAIRRRAASILTFSRPTDALRETLLAGAFNDLELSRAQLRELVKLTGEREGRGYGYTFSDLTTRLIPGAVLASFPDRPLDFKTIRAQAEIAPTPPFAEQGM
jgi:SpoVK/Ycf46/Vps4 family AAA+-type ATPase